MDDDTVTLATDLTVAWLSNANNRVSADDIPVFLRSMHDTLSALTNGSAADTSEPEQTTYEPAVSVRKSLASRDHIISLIDGTPYRTLRRHLTGHGMTPEQYRERYNLKSDYPMVAPSYSESRRDMAHKIGLGRKGAGAAAPVESPAAAAETPKRGRKPSGADALKIVRAKAGKAPAGDASESAGEE